MMSSDARAYGLMHQMQHENNKAPTKPAAIHGRPAYIQHYQLWEQQQQQQQQHTNSVNTDVGIACTYQMESMIAVKLSTTCATIQPIKAYTYVYVCVCMCMYVL